MSVSRYFIIRYGPGLSFKYIGFLCTNAKAGIKNFGAVVLHPVGVTARK